MKIAFTLFILILICSFVFAGWYPYYIPWSDGTSSPLHVGERLGMVPITCDSQRIYVRDGHIYRGAKRIRLFGTCLIYSAAIPTHAIADSIADNLAKMGFNALRFHALDDRYFPLGILDSTFRPSMLHFSPEAMDRLDYFISALAQRGIYIDICNTFRWWREIDGVPYADSLPKRGNFVMYFYKPMERVMARYITSLLTHYNPYRLCTYAQDPAIAMFELTNENSIFHAWYNRALEPGSETEYALKEPFRSILDSIWNHWLTTRYPSRDSLESAWAVGAHPAGSCFVHNGDFETIPPESVMQFLCYTSLGDTAEILWDSTSAASGRKSAKIVIHSVGSEVWGVFYQKKDLPVVVGRKMYYRFYAKASHRRLISVGFTRQAPPWGSLGLDENKQLDTIWKLYDGTFIIDDTSVAGRFRFMLAQDTGTVWLDEVEICESPAYGLLPDENPFSSDSAVRLADWSHRWLYSRSRMIDQMRFFSHLERGFYSRMHALIHDTLSCRAIVNTTQNYYTLASIYDQSMGDYIDAHGYWDNPKFPNRRWDRRDWYIYNIPQVGTKSVTVEARYSYSAVFGKPFFVTEFNHCYPNFYQAEMMPEFFSFALFQNWDGAFIYNLSNIKAYNDSVLLARWQQRYYNWYFNFWPDPKIRAQLPLWAVIFRKGLIDTARLTVVLRFSNDDALYSALIRKYIYNVIPIDTSSPNWQLPHIHSVRRIFDCDSTPHWSTYGIPAPPDTYPLVSDNGQIVWDENFVSVNAPAVRSVAGFLNGDTLWLGDVGFCWDYFGVVTVMSPAGINIEHANTLWVSAVSRSFNTDMGWQAYPGRGESTTVYNDWGREPILMEQIDGFIMLPSLDSAYVFALDEYAQPSETILISDSKIDLSTARTPWFMVVYPYRSGISDDKSPLKPGEITITALPNPFNGKVRIRISRRHSKFSDENITIGIYDISGRLIADFNLPSGCDEVIWDSRKASSGVYFICAESSRFSTVKRIVLLK